MNFFKSKRTLAAIALLAILTALITLYPMEKQLGESFIFFLSISVAAAIFLLTIGFIVYRNEKMFNAKNSQLEEKVQERTKEISGALYKIEGIHNFYKQIINTLPVPLFVKDRDLKYSMLNSAFLDFFGDKEEELLGKGVYELFEKKLADMYQKADEELMESDGIQIYEGEVKDREEKYHNVIFYKSVLNDQKGDFGGMMGVFLDITERKKLEEKLKEINRDLDNKVHEKIKELKNSEDLLFKQSKNAVMGEMIAAISHQLKQPINSLGIMIQTIGEFYQMGELNDKTVEDFQASGINQIRHMSKTIDHFRSFLAPDKKKSAYELSKTVDSVLTIVGTQLKSHNITIEREMEEITPFGVSGEMEHILLNLINNAKDAITKKQKEDRKLPGVIMIKAKKQDGQAEITIEDNAGGIEEEKIDRIFDQYYTTKGDKGTGLGLYMTKMIVEQSMKGTIEAKNNRAGVVFKLLIPLNKGERP